MLLTVLQAWGSQKAASTPWCRLALGKRASMGWSSSAGWLWERSLEHLRVAPGCGSLGSCLEWQPAEGWRGLLGAGRQRTPVPWEQQGPTQVRVLPGTASAGCLWGPWASHAFLCRRLARSKLGIICQAVPVLNKLRIGLNHSNKLNKGNIFPAPAGEAVALQAGLAHQRASIRGLSSF